jgi:multiple sugar transport system permease protein
LGELDWIGDPKVNIYGVMIVDIWMWTPFMMLLSVAGLSAIPEYLYEAAEIDRASGWFKFMYITLPLCSPLLMIAVLFRAVEAFKTFDIAMGITGVGAISPQLLSLRLYEKAFYRWDTGLSCAIAYVLLFIVIGMSNIFIRYLNKVRQ